MDPAVELDAAFAALQVRRRLFTADGRANS